MGGIEGGGREDITMEQIFLNVNTNKFSDQQATAKLPLMSIKVYYFYLYSTI